MGEAMAGKRTIEVGPSGRQVADNVARLRRARGLSTRGLAKALDEHGRSIPSSGLSRIEQGTRRVDVDDLLALAAALGVTPTQLWSDSLSIELRVSLGVDDG